MPPARQEYRGPELIGSFLAAVSEGHSGQSSRLIATRANGEPAFGTYYIDPFSGLVQQSGLLVLSLAGTRVSELTWFLGAGYLERFDLPSAPFVKDPVSKAP
jgi:RNA polymerase sigma-70 factor (ECF subfamily)